jgi:hypothetical protein
MTRSPLRTTRLTVATPPRRGAYPILVSILLHSTGFALLLHGLRPPPRIAGRPVLEPYIARLFNPPRSEPERVQRINTGVAYPGSLILGGKGTADPPLHGGLEEPVLSAPQTLVQPEASTDHLLAHVPPIPNIVMWSAVHTRGTIVSARPQPVLGEELRPSRVMPNHASDLADLAIAPTVSVIETPQMASSTTAPLRESAPGSAQPIFNTEAQPLEQSNATSIVSLSDLQARKPILIPLANATPAIASSELGVLGSSEKSGTGTGVGFDIQADSSSPGDSSGRERGFDVRLRASSQLDPDSGSEPSGTHISMPKNGQFGVVVVGASLAEESPESVAIWRGRLVYTVYLHVGLSKSWTLQFALPRVEEASSIARPEAPWPYEMIRPDLPSYGMTVHGFINVTGHFERLTIVSPTGFPQAKAVLDTLRQWQFRAARQNGQSAEVEVLLLIPEEDE